MREDDTVDVALDVAPGSGDGEDQEEFTGAGNLGDDGVREAVVGDARWPDVIFGRDLR